jgi:large subunit ribosomal protein L21
MHAIVRIAGVQARVEQGDKIRLPRLQIEAGENATFDDVLLVSDGDNITIGTPTVEGAKVEAEILGHDRGEKVIVYKQKRRKRYRRTNGHRQDYTEIKITDIVSGGASASETAAPVEAAEEE